MKKHLVIAIFLLSLVSCRTYYDKVLDYHYQLSNGNYEKAERDLFKNKFLKRNRNEVLKNLELGKVFHLQQLYDSSNYYFDKADLLMEDKSALLNTTTAVLANGAMTRYKGEDFERVLVNYYKALNYLYLNLNEDALVEAKRINIRLGELGDKQLMAGRRYKSDAFAHTLQGFIYERMRDYNNAFISYRNAYELYENAVSQQYMGSSLPEQLKIDLINTANKTGLYTERDEYCSKFNMPFSTVKDTSKYSLLVLWENGLAPIKQQEDIVLYLINGVGGDLVFSDKSGTINIPFPLPEKQKSNPNLLTDLNVLRIAYPKYVDLPLFYTSLRVESNNNSYRAESVENVTHIAHQTLKERFLKEMTILVSRIVLKKLAEAELKKENEAIGALAGIAGALTEKADTRNWESLPSTISYARIPVHKGENKLKLSLTAVTNQVTTDTLIYNAKSEIGILNYNTLKHLAPTLINNTVVFQ